MKMLLYNGYNGYNGYNCVMEGVSSSIDRCEQEAQERGIECLHILVHGIDPLMSIVGALERTANYGEKDYPRAYSLYELKHRHKQSMDSQKRILEKVSKGETDSSVELTVKDLDHNVVSRKNIFSPLELSYELSKFKLSNEDRLLLENRALKAHADIKRKVYSNKYPNFTHDILDIANDILDHLGISDI